MNDEMEKLTTEKIHEVIDELYSRADKPIQEALDDAVKSSIEPDVDKHLAMLYVMWEVSVELVDQVMRKHEMGILQKQMETQQAIKFYKDLGMGVD